MQELLTELRGLDDGALAAWAAGANRERLSLPFLGWLSDEELAASADEPDEQQALWELGSKLMALREGLSPVGAEVLQEELRAAALRCSGMAPPAAAGEGQGDGDAVDRPQDAGQPAASASQQQQQSAALVTPAFSSSVAATAALGLSPEGLSLFQQQAAALEAVVGTSRARSLTEVIGRARVQEGAQVQGLAEADAALRILDVLLSVTERDERAAMLPDAFTPPGSTAGVDEDAAYFSPEEEQLYTTPLRLLQAIDLYLSHLAGSGGTAPRGSLPALAGGGLGLSAAQLQDVLHELREDVEQFWAFGDNDAC
ncbi:hypothetical protein C2E20_5944 [Micractinium conductrix]|uniref:Uncharacterized protein n=1 Tax=Micractinium conductrix TaxID=554055 RepID=A0A2P6V9K5_9CHLO|nr:hypothetical protein C2E20_5944 [Micractinium conductrix]|eukprot:PSC70751.1 hypothetical protein C2E20_5944 [Micractinium conductrix]